MTAKEVAEKCRKLASKWVSCDCGRHCPAGYPGCSFLQQDELATAIDSLVADRVREAKLEVIATIPMNVTWTQDAERGPNGKFASRLTVIPGHVMIRKDVLPIPESGIIDCTGPEPVVRKVLGTLAVTRDGLVVGDDCTLLYQDDVVAVELMRSPHKGERGWQPFHPAKAYSTREAAAAAQSAPVRGEGQGNG